MAFEEDASIHSLHYWVTSHASLADQIYKLPTLQALLNYLVRARYQGRKQLKIQLQFELQRGYCERSVI